MYNYYSPQYMTLYIIGTHQVLIEWERFVMLYLILKPSLGWVSINGCKCFHRIFFPTWKLFSYKLWVICKGYTKPA